MGINSSSRDSGLPESRLVLFGRLFDTLRLGGQNPQYFYYFRFAAAEKRVEPQSARYRWNSPYEKLKDDPGGTQGDGKILRYRRTRSV